MARNPRRASKRAISSALAKHRSTSWRKTTTGDVSFGRWQNWSNVSVGRPKAFTESHNRRYLKKVKSDLISLYCNINSHFYFNSLLYSMSNHMPKKRVCRPLMRVKISAMALISGMSPRTAQTTMSRKIRGMLAESNRKEKP